MRKRSIQALDRMRPSQVERRTSDYRRHGTTSLFAALEVKTGRVIRQLHQRHCAVEFRQFLDTIDASVPSHLNVPMILDNYGIHNTVRIRRWLLKHPRFHLPFTPTSASGSIWWNVGSRCSPSANYAEAYTPVSEPSRPPSSSTSA